MFISLIENTHNKVLTILHLIIQQASTAETPKVLQKNSFWSVICNVIHDEGETFAIVFDGTANKSATHETQYQRDSLIRDCILCGVQDKGIQSRLLRYMFISFKAG